MKRGKWRRVVLPTLKIKKENDLPYLLIAFHSSNDVWLIYVTHFQWIFTFLSFVLHLLDPWLKFKSFYCLITISVKENFDNKLKGLPFKKFTLRIPPWSLVCLLIAPKVMRANLEKKKIRKTVIFLHLTNVLAAKNCLNFTSDFLLCKLE